MKIRKTPITDLLIIEPDIFEDKRGFFFESYNSAKFSEIGIDDNFVQDNISKSIHGTIRGLHYQVGKYAQGKICSALSGRVLDVALDIRFGSPTFGNYFAIELSSSNHLAFWIPPGFAHGFSVLSDQAIFHYKCTEFYDRESERCILYNDKRININWQVFSPIVSEKDMQGTLFEDIEKDFIY